jgi:hypothetical protein
MIKNIYAPPYREYWVVFSESKHWSGNLLAKNCSHCYVITRDKFNWIKLDGQQRRLGVEILPYRHDEDAPRIEAKHLNKILHVKMYRGSTKGVHKLLGLTNCVTFVKYVLGVKVWSLTPYQLFKALLRLDRSQMNQQGIVSVHQII